MRLSRLERRRAAPPTLRYSFLRQRRCSGVEERHTYQSKERKCLRSAPDSLERSDSCNSQTHPMKILLELAPSLLWIEASLTSQISRQKTQASSSRHPVWFEIQFTVT